jgi:hypothetical protein
VKNNSNFLAAVLTLIVSLSALSESEAERHNKAIWDLKGKTCDQTSILAKSIPLAIELEKQFEIFLSDYRAVYNNIVNKPILAEYNFAGQDLIFDRIKRLAERVEKSPVKEAQKLVAMSEINCLDTGYLSTFGWTYSQNSSRYGLYGFRSKNFQPPQLENYQVLLDWHTQDLEVYLIGKKNENNEFSHVLLKRVMLLERSRSSEDSRKQALIELNYCVDVSQRDCAYFILKPELYLDLKEYDKISEQVRMKANRVKQVVQAMEETIITTKVELDRIRRLSKEIPNLNHRVSLQMAPSIFRAACKYEIPYHKIEKKLNRYTTYGMGHLCPSQWYRDQ